MFQSNAFTENLQLPYVSVFVIWLLLKSIPFFGNEGTIFFDALIYTGSITIFWPTYLQLSLSSNVILNAFGRCLSSLAIWKPEADGMEDPSSWCLLSRNATGLFLIKELKAFGNEKRDADRDDNSTQDVCILQRVSPLSVLWETSVNNQHRLSSSFLCSPGSSRVKDAKR
ncbi:hypothetical protein RRG08_034733 [Elysia crispata]|uniref:Uncharacterized protein n=1 Tax=Elysia crispata TaxID=231223 RepID=A0AAE1CRH8_9GAST|nr:hypothetical protein RRG08_034733 [Elysia crispata]